jgi:hypothetical protein
MLDSIKERKKIARHDYQMARRHMMALGTLDQCNAGLLGLQLDVYKNIKDFPQICKAVEIMNEVELMKDYQDDEALVDARASGIPVSDFKKGRAEGIAAEKEKALKMVSEVLKTLKTKKTSSFPPRPKTSKQTREADVRTFLEPSPLITQADLMEAMRGATTSGLKFQTKEQAQRVYDEMSTKRQQSASITGFEVTIKPGTKCFHLKVDRADNSTSHWDNPDVFMFGFSEWVEMVQILEAKQQRNRFEKAWISILKKKINFKIQLEESLIDPQSAEQKSEPDAQSSKKRKTTESTSGSKQ